MSWSDKLEKLRKELATGKNFGQIWDYFFDHFGENDAFMRLGERHSDKNLETLLADVVSKMIGKKTNFREVLLTRIPEHKFVHGMIIAPEGAGTVFLFEELQLGLVGLSIMATGETPMARFSPQSITTILPENSRN